jgi:hypothetical protein
MYPGKCDPMKMQDKKKKPRDAKDLPPPPWIKKKGK